MGDGLQISCCLGFYEQTRLPIPQGKLRMIKGAWDEKRSEVDRGGGVFVRLGNDSSSKNQSRGIY